ncbi:MAG: type II toxin-antitoxin system mRNA interferase toxin, RelE/StbE family [Candidatus Taylorbacteria bacterium]
MEITYSNKFEKQYRKMSDDIRKLVVDKIAIFQNDCFDSRLKTHKLKGTLTGYYAFSLNNKYRIIFLFENDKNIRLHYIGTHDIYE